MGHCVGQEAGQGQRLSGPSAMKGPEEEKQRMEKHQEKAGAQNESFRKSD